MANKYLNYSKPLILTGCLKNTKNVCHNTILLQISQDRTLENTKQKY